ncbi:hypothetical protein HK102_004144 [Quaeritorhiza haematococci]|nr:hypothetical protein HK102_004144 [Quaeritorhiza haematococci]
MAQPPSSDPVQNLSNKLQDIQLQGTGSGSGTGGTDKKKTMPPPISRPENAPPLPNDDQLPPPPTPIITEFVGDMVPPAGIVNQRRGGVCITAPNERNPVSLDQIKEFYDKVS